MKKETRTVQDSFDDSAKEWDIIGRDHQNRDRQRKLKGKTISKPKHNFWGTDRSNECNTLFFNVVTLFY